MSEFKRKKISNSILLFFLAVTISAVHVLGQIDDISEEEDIADYNTKILINSTTDKSDNTTDDYDYEESEDSESECEDNKPTFLDKWKELYEQGKNVSIIKHVKHINETIDIWKQFKHNIGSLFMPSSDNNEQKYKVIEFLSEIDLGLSSNCLTAYTRMLMAISEGETWALKFVDSMGRPLVSGFSEGVESDFGEYSECLNIVSREQEDKPTIKGRYCLMKAILPFPPIESYKDNEPTDGQMFLGLQRYYGLGKLANIRAFIHVLNHSKGAIYNMGICIPSQCSAHEFQHFLNALLFPITRIPLEVGPQCYVKDQLITLDKYQIISITFLLISTLLIVLSTGYEIYVKLRSNNSECAQNEDIIVKRCDCNQLLTSFSIIRNTKSLFAKNKNFAALDTLRLFFIINVHLIHEFYLTIVTGRIGLKKILSQVMHQFYEDNEYILMRNPLIIDALFTLSGFLLSFCVLRKLDKSSGRFNYIEFIFQRIVRFCVLIFGAVLFFYLFPLTGDGPIWDIGVNRVTTGCQNPTNLLQLLFFVQNFRSGPQISLTEQISANESECIPHAWFLSSLLQLTLVGPIFIIIYHRKKVFGIIVLISAIFLSVLASIAPQILFNIRPYLQIWELDSVIFNITKSYTWWHFTPNNYCTAFFIGIAFGYLMRNNIQISRLKSALFWILSIVLCTSVYFWHNSFWRLDESAPLISVLLWHSIGKLMFCLGFGWIYLACCTGRGGYFTEILSWTGFQPIARLSFGIYILHYLVVMHRIFTKHYTYVMSDKYLFESSLVDLIYDIILAYIFYLLIESPFLNIFNHFMGLKVKSVDKTIESNIDSHKINNNLIFSSEKSVFGTNNETCTEYDHTKL